MLRVLHADAYRLLHSRLWWVLVASLALYAFEGTGVIQPWWFAQVALVALLGALAWALILRRKELR